MRVEYPRSPSVLAAELEKRTGVLLALLEGKPIGYISLNLGLAPSTTWTKDLVVERSYRRQGIGTALLLAAMEWALQMETNILAIEMQPKNHPAIQLVSKLGFEFCGYSDLHYDNHEIGIFFSKLVR